MVYWFRSKYPHLVTAAIAKSPPLVADAELRSFIQHVEEVAMDSNFRTCIQDLEKHVPTMRYTASSDPNKFLR